MLTNMAGTYSQIYIHLVFAVKGRRNLMLPSFEEEVYQYMAGIIRNKEQKPISINGMPDHVHLLVGLKPAMRISDLVRDVKNNTTNFINDRKWLQQDFAWQEGYGAFSYAESNFGKVADYIRNQKQHHARKTFQQEYQMFLKKFNISYQSAYLFDFYE